MMEGRQQVKTRMEKSPFNQINNQAAARGGLSGNYTMTQTSRGGVLFRKQHNMYLSTECKGWMGHELHVP